MHVRVLIAPPRLKYALAISVHVPMVMLSERLQKHVKQVVCIDLHLDILLFSHLFVFCTHMLSTNGCTDYNLKTLVKQDTWYDHQISDLLNTDSKCWNVFVYKRLEVKTSWYKKCLLEVETSWYKKCLLEVETSWYKKCLLEVETSWYKKCLLEVETSWYKNVY